MQNAAVVAGLVRGEFGFFFEQQNLHLRFCFQQPVRGGQADNTAADNDDVKIHLMRKQ